MHSSDPHGAQARPDHDTLVDHVGQIVSEVQSRDGVLPLSVTRRPPLPLEALQPLPVSGERTPTLDGPLMLAIARQALTEEPEGIVGLAQPETDASGARQRPPTMAYGELEALHPSTLERLDGTPAARPDVLCEIPIGGPTSVGSAREMAVPAPVQRFHSSRSPLDRPSTDALMARLPGPADDWRATTKDEELQQELNFAATSVTAKGPMGTAQVTSPGLTHIGTTLSPPRVTFHTHPNGVDAPGLELEADRSLSALPELVPRVMLIVLALLTAEAEVAVQEPLELMPRDLMVVTEVLV